MGSNEKLVFEYRKEVCGMCNDTGKREETVCVLCEQSIPHSSCDDTYYKKVICSCKKK